MGHGRGSARAARVVEQVGARDLIASKFWQAAGSVSENVGSCRLTEEGQVSSERLNSGSGRSVSRSGQVRAAATLTVVGGSLVIGGQPVAAASFEVTNTNGSGPGSLADAVERANETVASDTITFADGVAGTIDLGASTLGVSDSVDIIGPGPEVITLTNSDGDVFYLYNGADVSISGLAIDQTGGHAIGGTGIGSLNVADIAITEPGLAGIRVSTTSGDVEISGVTVTADSNDQGNGGVRLREVDGDVRLTSVSVSDVSGGDAVSVGYTYGDVSVADISVDVVYGGDGLSIENVRDGDVSVVDVSVFLSIFEPGVNVRGIRDGDVSLSRISIDGVYGASGLEVSAVRGDVSVNDASVTDVSDPRAMHFTNLFGDLSLTDVSVADADYAAHISNVDGRTDLAGVSVSSSRRGIVVVGVREDVGVSALSVNGGSRGIDFNQLGGALVVEGSTFVDLGGAAISAESVADGVTVANSTITGSRMGRIVIRGSDGRVESSTIAGNEMGGFVVASGGDVVVANSVVSGNGGGSPGSVSVDFEFSVLPVAASALGGSNVFVDDPGLGALGDRGGLTETMVPLVGSPVLDAGDPAGAGGLMFDQRGGPRVVGGAVDIGAVEVYGGRFDVADVSVGEGVGVVDVVVTRSSPGDFGASVDVATVAGTAVEGDDFVATSTSLVWADGETGPKTVSVPIVSDDVFEGDETFSVVLLNELGAVLGDASGVVTITDPVAVVSLSPDRFVDTRPSGTTLDGVSEAEGKLVAGGQIVVQVAGRGGVPADATGVVMNVTAVQAEGVGFVTVHACEDPVPNVSALNYSAGVNTGNEVFAQLDADGRVCVFTSEAAHITADVVGFVGADSPVVTVVPSRVLDTRAAGDTVDDLFQGEGRTGVESTTVLPVGGRAGVPADAAAVIVNVTAVGPSETGFVTVSPCVSPVPTASSLNYVAGVNRANELVASLDEDGQICLFTSTDVHLLVDVVAYLPVGSDVTGVSPSRLLDTRASGETVDAQSEAEGKLEAAEEYVLQVAGRGGVPAGASAVVVNVTAVQAEGNGFVTVHPCVDPRPLASSLNYVPGVNGANEIVALLNDDGELCLYTSQAAHLIVDVVAYIN